MRTRSAAVLLALALLLAACAEEEVLVNPPTAALPGTRWVVAGLTVDGTGGALPAGAHLTLDFGADGNVSGTAGCNSYFATVVFTADGLAMTSFGATEMACEPEIMEREARFLAALGRIATAALEGDVLTLASADGAVAIELVPFVPEADRPLAATVWHLTTLLDGEAASSIVAGTEPILEVDDVAGRLSGNSGCNSFFGPATFTGSGVTVGAIGATKMACEPGVMEQEAFVFAVLADAVSWDIEGTVLRIAAADGRALEFSAG